MYIVAKVNTAFLRGRMVLAVFLDIAAAYNMETLTF